MNRMKFGDVQPADDSVVDFISLYRVVMFAVEAPHTVSPQTWGEVMRLTCSPYLRVHLEARHRLSRIAKSLLVDDSEGGD